MTKDIVVHTTFRLRGPTRGFQPDVVIWNGNRYVVRDIRDWTQFGVGYIRAECESMSHLDHPDKPPEDDE
jgi:galactose-6-phosphate isomerase